MQLKIHGSRLTCKVANKCLNVHEWMGVVDLNKRWFLPFPYWPVNCQRWEVRDVLCNTCLIFYVCMEVCMHNHKPHAKACLNLNWSMNLIFCMWFGIHKYNLNFQYIKTDLSYIFEFLYRGRHYRNSKLFQLFQAVWSLCLLHFCLFVL